MHYINQTMEHFEKLALEKDVVLFGSGEFCMRFMNRIGDLTDRVKYILDNNSEKWGGKLYGIPLVGPEILREQKAENTLVVITAGRHIPDIYAQIQSMGDFPIMAGRIIIHDVFSLVAKELHQGQELIEKVYQSLYDETSKKIYREVVKRRMLYGECDFSDLIISGDWEYRLPLQYSENKPKDEVILDCGAFEGDTLKYFIDTFGPTIKKIYAFECREDTLEKLKKMVCYAQNRNYVPEIEIMPYALSDHEGKMVFAKTTAPGASFVIERRSYAKKSYDYDFAEVNVSTIDKLISAEEKVTLIKMDIEGSEYEAILGAKRVIQTCKPKLAISIYHSGKDYYRLPLLVKELVPEYKIAIRHHQKSHVDTDMYCWV